MNSAIERLLTLRVRDVMTREVIQVHAHQTMCEAATVFAEHEISGAPVVDDVGRCVGVLSAADFVRKEKICGADILPPEVPEIKHPATVLVQDNPGEPFHVEAVGEEAVSQHMSRELASIAAEAPLMEAARAMCGRHIHRLPVLDDHGRPVGLVTSLDVVAAVVKAIEE